MIQVEIVVAGALGDLVVSMFPELDADRRLDTCVAVTGQAAAATLLATLGRAGIEVTSVVEAPEVGGTGSGPPDDDHDPGQGVDLHPPATPASTR